MALEEILGALTSSLSRDEAVGALDTLLKITQ